MWCTSAQYLHTNHFQVCSKETFLQVFCLSENSGVRVLFKLMIYCLICLSLVSYLILLQVVFGNSVLFLDLRRSPAQTPHCSASLSTTVQFMCAHVRNTQVMVYADSNSQLSGDMLVTQTRLDKKGVSL